MDAEIVQWVDQAGPYLAAALGAYGAGVFTRAEGAAVDATAALGRRILQAVWRRQGPSGQGELEEAVVDAAEGPGDAGACAPLRRLLTAALREDALLRDELAALLEASGSGARAGDHSPSVFRSSIGGDNIQIGRAGGDVRIGRA